MKRNFTHFAAAGRIFGAMLLTACLSFPAFAQTGSCSCAENSAVNGDFEEVNTAVNGWAGVLAADLPGWSTTDPTGRIEVWDSGHGGVASQSGGQHVELNYNNNSTIYQDVATCGGRVYQFRVYHRARLSSQETAMLQIGPVNGPSQVEVTMVGQTADWTEYTGVVYIPAGQTTTRLTLTSLTYDGGNASYGNFLDNISFAPISCSQNAYACGKNNEKVIMCHNGHEICIAPSAVAAHLAHGCTIGTCAVPVRVGQAVQELQVYPNPAKGQFTVVLNATESGAGQVIVLDALGRRVATVFQGELEAGEMRQVNATGLSLPAGIYVVLLRTEAATRNVRLVIE